METIGGGKGARTGNQGGEADGRQFEDEGVYESFWKPKGPTLGSTTRIMEQGSTCAGPPQTRVGRFLSTETGKSGLEEFGRGEGDSDCVTDHQVGAGGGD